MQPKQITHLNFAKGFRGGERQTQLLIEELSRQGYAQKLLVRKNSELLNKCKDIKNLKIIEISKPYILHIKYIKNSSLLHAHETKALQYAYFASKITRIPYIVTRRVDNKIKNNLLNKKLYQSAQQVIALSKAIEKEILTVAPNANTTIIPSAFTNTPVNKEKSKVIKKRFKDKFLVGHIGALDDKHKGQSFLIEAAKLLYESHPNIHFIFVGGGKDELILKKLAEGYNNISFEGFVDNVNDYINCFDLFVFPSRNEGLGSILFDVMQLGVPIIASHVGGIPDIICHKKNGLLIQACNSDEIYKNILYLYNNPHESILLQENAIENISLYSSTNMTGKYISIYESAISKNILIFLHSRPFFGAQIVQIPLIYSILKSHPAHNIILLSKHTISSVLLDTDLVAKLHITKSNFENIQLLRYYKPETCITMRRNSFILDIAIYFYTKYDKIGFRTLLRKFLFSKTLKTNLAIYRADNFLRLLANNTIPQYLLAEDNNTTDNIYLLVGGSAEYKLWGVDNYLKLATQLTQYNPQVTINFVLGDSEKQYTQEIKDYNDQYKILFNYSIDKLIKKFQYAKLIISNDCGPSHIAHIVDAHRILLFSDIDSKAKGIINEWFKKTDNSEAIVSKNKLSIRTITIEEVFTRSKDYL